MVVFNHGIDDLHSDSLQSVHSGHCSQVTSPVALMAVGPPILNKILGHNLHLPIDLIFGTNTADLKGSSITYIENLKKRMAWVYQTANDVIKKEQERNKQCYDCRVQCTKLMIGDKVLLQHTAYKGKHKIQDHWEDTIYEVVEQPFENMPVFKIKSWGVMTE